MPFTYWPSFTSSIAKASSDIQLWLRMIELWFACGEVAAMLTGLAPEPNGGPRWPKHNMVWDRGIVTAVTSTTVSTENDDGTPNEWCQIGEVVNVPWNCQHASSPPPVPSSWRLVIEDCDPRKIVIVDIASWDEDTLTVPDLTHFVTERVIPSLASLVGKTYFIIRQDYGIWWSQRIPQWPNNKVFFKGSNAVGVPNPFTATATTITDAAPKKIGTAWVADFTVDQWKDDYDIIFKDAGGAMRRGSITGNTTDTITFSGAGGTPSNTYPYYIIAKDGLYQWDRVPDKPFAWYTGLTESFWSLYPDDTLQTTDKPQLQINHPVGLFCTPQDDDVWDTDLWNGTDAACSTDFSYNPWIAKSLRYVQKFFEDTCRYCISTGNYSGVEFKPVPFSVAALFEAAGINAQRSTTGTPDPSGIPVSLAVPWAPIGVWYEIQDGNGTTLAQGFATYDGTKLVGSFDTIEDPPDDPSFYLLEGRTIIVSLGWTEKRRRTVKHVSANDGVLIPDTDFAGDPIDPPTESDPGKYLARPASTHYIAPSDSSLGKMIEGDQPHDEIHDGDRARYVGDNWNDPPVFGTNYFSNAVPQPLLPYYKCFWTGSHERAGGTYATIEAQKRFVATAGSSSSITQNTHDWFDHIWYARSVIDYTGTATGGSSTTLVDSTKAGSAHWDPARGYWSGCILEILDGGGNVTHKLPITATNQGTATLTVISDGYTIAAGNSYRIRMPRQRNRWKSLKLRLTDPDGVTYDDVMINYSDDKTLWFDEQDFEVGEGWTAQIIEIECGMIVDRVGAEWVEATGTLVRADLVQRYGKIMLGDLVCATVLNEIIAVNNLLQSTFHQSITWTSRGDPNVEEKNVRMGTAGYTNGSCDFVTNVKTPAEANFAANRDPCVFPDCFPDVPGQPHEIDGQTPTAVAKYFFGPDTGACGGQSDLIRVTGHGKIIIGDGDACPIDSETDFYARTTAPVPFDWPEDIPADGICNDDITIPAADPPPPFVPLIYSAAFDNNDDVSEDTPLICHRFVLFSTSGVSYTIWGGTGEGGGHDHTGLIDRRSGKLGQRDIQPIWPSKLPPNPGSTEYNSHARGWVVQDTFAITNWFRRYILPITDEEFFDL